MSPILPFITLISAGIFTGAAIYINVAEHPARLTCTDSPQFMLKQWQQSYNRAAIMQASMALTSCLFGLLTFFFYSKQLPFIWFIASLLIGAIVPFTIFVIMPTNDYLHRLRSDNPTLIPTLQKWGQLHGLRAIASSIGFVIFVWVIITGN
jgi:hypothetical protein